jgi:biopolymer transport protein TolR
MRRMREHVEETEEEGGELNLVPYLDIITNIIIFLLASVAYNVAFGNVNVTLPTLAQGSGAVAEEPEQPPLNLTVTASNTGFIIAGGGGVMAPIPKLPDGKYDYQGLTARLMEIKAAPGNANETKVTFNADAQIPYEIVVESLDAMRTGKDSKELFPDVVFAAGIL